MAIKKSQTARLVQGLINSKKGDDIYGALIRRGVTACVAREWAGEPRRRAFLTRLHAVHRARWEASLERRRGAAWNNIIHTRTTPPKTRRYRDWDRPMKREFLLHATKGWRDFRGPPA